MPAKNKIKSYVEDGFYHAYNRGVDKRTIFLDDEDYRVFLNLLKIYLSPTLKDKIQNPLIEAMGISDSSSRKSWPFQSLCDEAELLAYVLMPNHFHLFLKQISKDGMTKLLRKVSTMYVMYFNRKYERSGTLFQGTYKAVLVDKDSYFLHLSRYIHFSNPKEIIGSEVHKIRTFPYSSYAFYLGKKKANWLHSEYILNCFQSVRKISFKDLFSYQSFVEQYEEEPRSTIPDLLIDSR